MKVIPIKDERQAFAISHYRLGKIFIDIKTNDLYKLVEKGIVKVGKAKEVKKNDLKHKSNIRQRENTNNP